MISSYLTSSSFSAKVDFRPASAAVPSGYVTDGGAAYGNRGNGYSYGWNAINSSNAFEQNAPNSPDQRYDTLVRMQVGGTFTWQIAVPNGSYRVRVVAGDPNYYTSSLYRISVEGVLTVDGTPTDASRWVEGTNNTVTVSDGKLTVTNAAGSLNNKISLIKITSQ